MVVFDIDGTIKNDQYPSSENFLDIINKLKSENCFVTIATGRMSLSAKQNSVFIPNAPIITYQGAKILDYSNFVNLTLFFQVLGILKKQFLLKHLLVLIKMLD